MFPLYTDLNNHLGFLEFADQCLTDLLITRHHPRVLVLAHFLHHYILELAASDACLLNSLEILLSLKAHCESSLNFDTLLHFTIVSIMMRMLILFVALFRIQVF